MGYVNTDPRPVCVCCGTTRQVEDRGKGAVRMLCSPCWWDPALAFNACRHGGPGRAHTETCNGDHSDVSGRCGEDPVE